MRRRELGYPPFRHLVSIVGDRLRRRGAASGCCASCATGSRGAELLGPAPLLRLRGRHRAQLVAKTDRPRAVAARAARDCSRPPRRRCGAAGVTAVVDVDPQSL